MSTSSVACLGKLAYLSRHIPAFLIHAYVFYVNCILTLGLAAVAAANCHKIHIKPLIVLVLLDVISLFLSSVASFCAVPDTSV